MQVRFRLEAMSDVVSAWECYDEQKPGLGADFVRSLEDTVAVIVEFPQAFPDIAAGHRRAILKRVPYVLYYCIGPHGIGVLACVHSSRAPDTFPRIGMAANGPSRESFV